MPAILAQSPSGFIGRLTRTTPLPKVTAALNDKTTPVSYFGLAVIDTASSTVRNVQASDAGRTSIAGIAVQPYPFQASSTTNFGAQDFSDMVPVPPGVVDVNRSGFQTVYCNGAENANQTSPVCVWVAPTSGPHIQGGFEIAPSASAVAMATAGNTGNGALSVVVVDATAAQNGSYSVQFTGATAFNVYDANGRALLAGKTGVAYVDGGLSFTITAGGTAFVAGDSISIVVTFQTITLDSKSYFNGPGDPNGAAELAFNL